MNLTEKNELSYMFSLFRVNAEANYYAIDEESGEIIGSTNTDCVGKNLTEIGLSLDRIINNKNGFHNNVNGSYSFCVFKKLTLIILVVLFRAATFISEFQPSSLFLHWVLP